MQQQSMQEGNEDGSSSIKRGVSSIHQHMPSSKLVSPTLPLSPIDILMQYTPNDMISSTIPFPCFLNDMLALGDLPPYILAYITNMLPLSCTVELGLASKLFHTRLVSREPEFMTELQLHYHFCYLLKKVVESHSSFLMPSLHIS